MRQMIYRIMTEDGKFPKRSGGRIYTDLFYNKAYAERCEKAIRQFNTNTKMIIEETEVQWARCGY